MKKMKTSNISKLGVGITVEELMETIGNDGLNNSLFQYRLIGSARGYGTKAWLGDIDIAVSEADMSRSELKDWLINIFGEDHVSNKGVLSLSFPIYVNKDYTPLKTSNNVQVDFMFGDLDIMQCMYFSPRKDDREAPSNSPLKGKHCHILFSEYSILYPLDEVYHDNHHKTVTKWKWSFTNGLQIVNRTLMLDVHGEWKVYGKDRVVYTCYPDLYDMSTDFIYNLCDSAIEARHSRNHRSLMSAENFLSALAKYKGEGVALSLVDSISNDPQKMKEWTHDEIEYLRNYVNELETGGPINGE